MRTDRCWWICATRRNPKGIRLTCVPSTVGDRFSSRQGINPTNLFCVSAAEAADCYQMDCIDLSATSWWFVLVHSHLSTFVAWRRWIFAFESSRGARRPTDPFRCRSATILSGRSFLVRRRSSFASWYFWQTWKRSFRTTCRCCCAETTMCQEEELWGWFDPSMAIGHSPSLSEHRRALAYTSVQFGWYHQRLIECVHRYHCLVWWVSMTKRAEVNVLCHRSAENDWRGSWLMSSTDVYRVSEEESEANRRSRRSNGNFETNRIDCQRWEETSRQTPVKCNSETTILSVQSTGIPSRRTRIAWVKFCAMILFRSSGGLIVLGRWSAERRTWSDQSIRSAKQA